MMCGKVVLSMTMFLAAGAETALMSMWHRSSTIVSPSGACEFASDLNLNGEIEAGEGMNSPAAQSKYIQDLPRMYCAVSDSLYQGGRGCGKCYQLTGPAGTHTVQVVSRMERADRLFDCQLDSFKALTGAETDVFSITYEEVDCDTDSARATRHVFNAQADAGRLSFTSVLFFNVKRGVHDVTMTVGNRATPIGMTRHGSRWDTNGIGGGKKPIHFVVTLGDGEQVTYDASDDAAFAAVDVTPPPCSGAPCEQGMCRSQWDSCGFGDNFCNEDSLWTPQCSDSDVTTTTTTTTTSTTVGDDTADTTTTTTTTTTSTTVGENDGVCIGEPCPTQGHCRSKWGWCGITAGHCNTESLWCGSQTTGCVCQGNQHARRLRGRESQ